MGPTASVLYSALHPLSLPSVLGTPIQVLLLSQSRGGAVWIRDSKAACFGQASQQTFLLELQKVTQVYNSGPELP